MKNKTKTVVLALAFLLFGFFFNKTEIKATDFNENKIVELVNTKRADINLPALKINTQLNEAAKNKALDMFKDQYWAHNSPSGKTPWTFIRAAKYKYRYAGENLAKGFESESSLVEGWMNSTSHRENMLSKKYNEVGIADVEGTLNGEKVTLTVMMMGNRSVTLSLR